MLKIYVLSSMHLSWEESENEERDPHVSFSKMIRWLKFGMVLLYVYDLRDAAGGGDGRGEGELNEEGTGYSPIFEKYTGSFFYYYFWNDTASFSKWYEVGETKLA